MSAQQQTTHRSGGMISRHEEHHAMEMGALNDTALSFRSGKAQSSKLRHGIVLGMAFIVVMAVVWWWFFVFNAPYRVMRMGGPLFNSNGQEEMYLVQTRTHPSFFILTLSPKKDVWVSKQIITRGWWESAIEQTIEEVLGEFFSQSKDCTVIDVGGNIGFFSLLTAAWGCKVTTYEIQPEMVKRITASATINAFHNVKVVNKGVASTSGNLIKFQLGSFDNMGSAYAAKASENDENAVTTVTLDEEFSEIIKKKTRITMLKIDVEGYEPDVLDGAVQLIHYVDNVVVEANSQSVLTKLVSAGFNKVTVLEEPRWFWSFFVKRAPSRTFINPTEAELRDYLSHLQGKRDVWFRRV